MSLLGDLARGPALLLIAGSLPFEADSWQLEAGRLTAIGRRRRPDGRRGATTTASWPSERVIEVRELGEPAGLAA